MKLTEREQHLVRNPTWAQVVDGARFQWLFFLPLMTLGVVLLVATEGEEWMIPSYGIVSPLFIAPIGAVATALCTLPAFRLAALLRDARSRGVHLSAFFGLGAVASSALVATYDAFAGWDGKWMLWLLTIMLITGVSVTSGWTIALHRAVRADASASITEALDIIVEARS